MPKIACSPVENEQTSPRGSAQCLKMDLFLLHAPCAPQGPCCSADRSRAAVARASPAGSSGSPSGLRGCRPPSCLLAELLCKVLSYPP